MPDLASSKSTIRNLIVKILGEHWPLSARQLYSLVREELKIVTYQGVHKALGLLLDEGVITREDKRYRLSVDWIREMRILSENLERNYTGRVEPLSYLYSGSGVSSDPDASTAGKKATESALRELARPPDFALVFCHGSTYAKNDERVKSLVKAVDETLKKRNPNCRWFGFTTDGEISDKGCFFNSCSVLALKSDHLFFGVGVGDNASKDFFAAGKQAAASAATDLKNIDPYLERYMRFLAVKRKQPEALLKTKPHVLLTVFPGPVRNYQPNEEELLRGIQEVTGIQPLFGGSASDSAMFKQTYQFANGKVYKDACIVVALLSDLKLAFSIRHGLKPTKKQVLVTKAVGNRVFSLDGKPAARVYAKLLGLSVPELKKKLFKLIIRFPFGMADPLGHYWIKTPFAVNPDYSLVFLNKVPQNALLVLMDSDEKSILDSTKAVLTDIKTKLGPDIPLIVLFDCGSRPRALSTIRASASSEFEVFKKELPASKIIGAYTHGEQALIPSGTIGQHNQTIIALGISNELISE